MSRTAPKVEAAAAVEARLGHVFSDPALLRRALTHSSVGDGRAPAGGADNERLEFLGDRVLGLIVAERLFQAFPQDGEANLALRYNAIVNRSACARAARALGVGPALILSPGEDRGGGREKEAILADACEALIAAIYLDAGFEAARRVVIEAFAPAFEGAREPPRDPKTQLQEWAASAHKATAGYRLVGRSGPDHAPKFDVEVRLSGELGLTAMGSGGSKRDAERAAARALLVKAGVAHTG